MLTDQGLEVERPHHLAMVGGVQRLYRWGRWGLSLVNGKMLHAYSFAWEAAVQRYKSDAPNAKWELDYSTPLTNDVEVFETDEETNAFIEKARAYFLEHP